MCNVPSIFAPPPGQGGNSNNNNTSTNVPSIFAPPPGQGGNSNNNTSNNNTASTYTPYSAAPAPPTNTYQYQPQATPSAPPSTDEMGAIEAQQADADEEEQLRQAIEASTATPVDDDEEEQFRKAIEESLKIEEQRKLKDEAYQKQRGNSNNNTSNNNTTSTYKPYSVCGADDNTYFNECADGYDSYVRQGLSLQPKPTPSLTQKNVLEHTCRLHPPNNHGTKTPTRRILQTVKSREATSGSGSRAPVRAAGDARRGEAIRDGVAEFGGKLLGELFGPVGGVGGYIAAYIGAQIVLSIVRLAVNTSKQQYFPVGADGARCVSSKMNKTLVEGLYCTSGHPMFKKIHKGNHECNICACYLPSGSNHSKCNGGGSCTYDLCSDCEGKQLRGATKVAQTKLRCPNDHDLEMRVVLPSGKDGTLICSGCKGALVSGNVFLPCKCSTGDHNYCMTCIVNRGWREQGASPGRKDATDNRCPKGHVMYLKSHISTRYCNHCQRWLVAGSVHPKCSDCDYDLCVDCVTRQDWYFSS